jgi:hypothetical protein
MFHLRVCWFTDLYFCLNLDTLAARGEASSKMTLVHTLLNRKEHIHFYRKYMENLKQVLTNLCFTMVHVHQGKLT